MHVIRRGALVFDSKVKKQRLYIAHKSALDGAPLKKLRR